MAFAPARHPKIAVAVYLENAGFGATEAAPCAALVIEKYLRGRIAPRRKRWERCMQYRGLAYERERRLGRKPRSPPPALQIPVVAPEGQ